MSEKFSFPVTTFFYPASAENSVLIYEQAISFVLAWLEEKQVSFCERYLETIQEEEKHWMSYTIELDRSVEEIAELNFKLVLELADLPQLILDNFIIKLIQVKPREESHVASE